VHDGLVVELHLVSDDPQLDDIRRGSPAVIEVDEVLASAPSHWIDPSDATHADQFYRCAALRSGSATETTTDPAAVVTSRAGAAISAGGPACPVSSDNDLYRRPMARLTTVRVRGTSMRSKFKLAQRTGRESRAQIVQGL
jgi:hypothetical protein